MKINIKATNFELTEAIRNYVEEKLGALEKMLPVGDDSVMADVEVGKINKHHQHGQVFKAEVNLHFKHHYLRAEAFHEDLYAAIDEMQDEIARQINTSIEKRHTLMRRGGRVLKNMLRGAAFWRWKNKYWKKNK